MCAALKLAAMCQFTLPHPPVVYYGTEVGLSQQRDVRSADGSGHPEESRLPMPWGAAQDRDLLAFYRRLVALRHRTPGLWRAARTTLAIDDETGFYAYRCGDPAGGAIVTLNNGREPLPFRPATGGTYRLALATDPATELDGGVLVLPPFGGAVLLATDERH